MITIFKSYLKSAKEKTIEELNAFTSYYTSYQWAYTSKDPYTEKEGFYISFPKNSMPGDVLMYFIQEALRTQGLEVDTIGNDFNAKSGKRVLISSHSISSAKIENAKDYLFKECGPGEKSTLKPNQVRVS